MRKQSYLTEDIEKVIGQFQDDVEKKTLKMQKKFKDSGIFIGPPKMTSGIDQYSGVIFWYKWTFSPEIREELSERYIDITGIHIKPYRITKDVVKAAKQKGKIVKSKKELIMENLKKE